MKNTSNCQDLFQAFKIDICELLKQFDLLGFLAICSGAGRVGALVY